ncbi:MAG: hypothetical protein AUI14_18380 [Actinobacteria bacterium 13_2_20CM_2_71_6]|nr:MAG: hypothetical protein AUI14_18380 [Actinobacteria bacterium 13_2_20CM_2_71_6]
MRPMRRLLALLAAVVLVLGAPNPAHADPDPDGSGANGTLQDQFAATAKAYADAKSKLDTALARQEQFRAQLAASNARIVELSDQVGLLAAAVYRSGPASTFAVMLDSTSPDELVERAEALRQLSRTEDRQLRELTAVLDSADQQQAALDQEITAAKAQTDEMAKRKAQLQHTLDQLGNGPTAGVPIPAASAEPVPRNPDGSLPNESCSLKDPTTSGCLTPRTLHALQQARKAGFTHYTACFRNGTWGEHPLGRACDFAAAAGGFGGIAGGSDRDYGNRLAGWCIANADRLGVLYVIWYHQVWTPAIGWHYYRGDGTPSGDHMNHVHLSER